MSGRLTFWVVFPCLLAALLGQTVEGAHWLRASQTVKAVEARTVEVVRMGRAPAQLLHANVVELERAARLDPSNVGVLIALGSQYLVMRVPDTAIETYRRALRLEPRPEIYLNIARAYLMEGNRASARRNFRLALRLSPGLRREIPREFRHRSRRRASQR